MSAQEQEREEQVQAAEGAPADEGDGKKDKKKRRHKDKDRDKEKKKKKHDDEARADGDNGSAKDPKRYNKQGRLRKEVYEKEVERLATELVKLQYWVKHKGLKMVVIFEGRDAAGKGGVIKTIAAPLNPRGCRVVAETDLTHSG